MSGQNISERDILLGDVQGRAYHPASVRQTAMDNLELDISNLGSGIYWIKVRTGNTFRVFQLIKL
jgi:hypothetical protein